MRWQPLLLYQNSYVFSRNSGILCTVSVKYQKTGVIYFHIPKEGGIATRRFEVSTMYDVKSPKAGGIYFPSGNP